MNGTRVIIIKKKAKGHAAHHGGAWKVAYADFVTAMMALFIVLWLLSQTDQETRKTLSEYFRTGVFSGAPSVVTGGSGISQNGFLDVGDQALKGEQQRLSETATLVREALANASGDSAEIRRLGNRVDVQVISEGLLIQIMDGAENVFFDLSSAELKPELKEMLEVIAPVLAKLGNKLQIQGHTDARPFPTASHRTNWELSFERADNARVVLQDSGVSASQISGVFAYADTVLKVAKDPRADANRRLAILAVRHDGGPSNARNMTFSSGAYPLGMVRPTVETTAESPKLAPTPL